MILDNETTAKENNPTIIYHFSPEDRKLLTAPIFSAYRYILPHFGMFMT